MTLTRIYAPSLLLCLFVLAHCLDLPHGDNMTDINQSVLACSCAFNYQSSTPRSPSAMLQLTCHRHLRRSYCRQQAPSKLLRSPFPFLLDFDLRETFFRRPSSRVLFFGRLQYRPLCGRLQHGLTFERLPSQPSHFNLVVLGPYSPLQIWFVMGAHCFLFACSFFFCVY